MRTKDSKNMFVDKAAPAPLDLLAWPIGGQFEACALSSKGPMCLVPAPCFSLRNEASSLENKAWTQELLFYISSNS